MSLPRGLYEVLVTELLRKQLKPGRVGVVADTETLRSAEAADRIALHLARVIERAIDAVPDEDRAELGAQLANRLVEHIALDTKAEELREERLAYPAAILRAIRGVRPDGRDETIDLPLIPLLDTTLLTNAPGEPRVGRQVQAEIASADRIDLVMAFIRRSGIAPLRDDLRRHVEAGRPLRVLTTTYTGSTEAEALELLRSLGADVRVSYDTTGTRLHAKAW